MVDITNVSIVNKQDRSRGWSTAADQTQSPVICVLKFGYTIFVGSGNVMGFCGFYIICNLGKKKHKTIN